jgi:hypothetical protein
VWGASFAFGGGIEEGGLKAAWRDEGAVRITASWY